MDEDKYRDGSLWRHKTKGDMVTVKATTEDTVWFVYEGVAGTVSGSHTTSKPIFEMFYDKVDPSEEGLIYLSKV